MVKEGSYITIQSFMVNDLNLKGNELLVYAIIYGLTQDNKSEFKGSRTYLANWCNTSLPTIDKALNNLIDKGFIIKHTQEINRVIFNTYSTNFIGSKETLYTPKKTLHNNIDNNIKDKEKEIKQEKVDAFNEFWSLYPKHTSKKTAETAFYRLTKQETKDIIVNLKLQLPYINDRPMQYIAHPTTYIRQKRFYDDLDSLKQNHEYFKNKETKTIKTLPEWVENYKENKESNIVANEIVNESLDDLFK